MEDLIDLGSMSGDVLAFGGAVSNAHAMAALGALASARGFDARHMVCTGDVVAYCGQPAKAVAELRALGAATIRGNCEDALARRAVGLTQGYERALASGWWPSEEVLPADLRRAA